MKHKILAIKTDPNGDKYGNLLEFASQHCQTFSLTWKEGRDSNWYDHVPSFERNSINEVLQPFVIQEILIEEWLGVRTYQANYHLVKETINILREAGSLYLWADRNGPKDLSFYMPDGKPWLISYSEEKVAYIYPIAIPIDLIKEQLPELDVALDKPKIYINGQNFGTLEQFYDEISEKMIPGAYWGRNLDAFDDILYGGFGTPEYGFVLVWQSAELSKEKLGYSETIKQLEARKQRCHPSNIPLVDEQLEKATRNEGPTVFDWLVEIIERHEIIDLILE